MKMNYLQDERRMVRGVWSSIAAFPSGSSAARRDRPHHLPLQALHSCAFFTPVTGDGPAVVSHSCLSEACDLSSAAAGLEIAGGQDGAGDCPQAAHGSERRPGPGAQAGAAAGARPAQGRPGCLCSPGTAATGGVSASQACGQKRTHGDCAGGWIKTGTIFGPCVF